MARPLEAAGLLQDALRLDPDDTRAGLMLRASAPRPSAAVSERIGRWAQIAGTWLALRVSRLSAFLGSM